MVAKEFPMVSDSLNPNTRSAPGFQLQILPSASSRKMAWSFRFSRTYAIFRADEKSLAASADPEAMEKVIFNLLSNAIKFTPRGGTIEVGVDRSQALTLLFDPEHALDERIAMEQFAV